jgi:hypothetical protein
MDRLADKNNSPGNSRIGLAAAQELERERPRRHLQLE